MRRGRPTNALGGTPRKDHLFEDGRSLCLNWMYGGGREVHVDEVDLGDDDLCQQCASNAEVIADV